MLGHRYPQEGGHPCGVIAEDEADLAEALADGLRREGFTVDVVGDGSKALDHVATHDVDVVVLDRDLPVLHGDVVCRALVAAANPARILMLTAAGTLSDRVTGLELGADDYLAKPFAYLEMWPASAPWAAAAARPGGMRCWSVAVCDPTPPAGLPSATGDRCGSRRRRWQCCRRCWRRRRRPHPDPIARRGVGRPVRPHPRGGEGRRALAPPQARRPAGDPHRGRPRLPDPLNRKSEETVMPVLPSRQWSFRTRLAVTITAVFIGAGAALLFVEYVAVSRLFDSAISAVVAPGARAGR